ncbi:AzlD domain-containing protein [Psychrobacter sp. B38]|uniref:AzlD domain-containing protein n=1 Tax=Psychrobacter sp. B38 TaxID=3143538 RepID=UPI00320CE82E
MITASYFTAAIVVMAVITFISRYFFFTTSFQIRIPPRIEALFVFTAPCILIALVVPIVFQAGLAESGEIGLLSSSYFWAGLLAIGLSVVIRQTLLVIILSMAGFYALRSFGLS